MKVKCPNCGTENWLENQSKCLRCDAILRRCIDCSQYDRAQQRCTDLDTDIDLHEAEHPTLLANSTNCRGYRPLGQRV